MTAPLTDPDPGIAVDPARPRGDVGCRQKYHYENGVMIVDEIEYTDSEGKAICQPD